MSSDSLNLILGYGLPLKMGKKSNDELLVQI